MQKSTQNPSGDGVDGEKPSSTKKSNVQGPTQTSNPKSTVSADLASSTEFPKSSKPTAPLQLSRHQSAAYDGNHSSPHGSRDSSPLRQVRRTTSPGILNPSRSRKNSQPEVSPSRQARSSVSGTTLPSKSLSSTTIPALLPSTSDSQFLESTPQKASVALDGRESRRWPVSPRLRSPPPQLTKSGSTSSASAKRSDSVPPAISLQKSSPAPQLQETSQSASENSETEDSQTNSGLRTPARGSLETVQEVSLPGSPTPKATAFLDHIKARLSPDEASGDSTVPQDRTPKAKNNASLDASIDAAETKAEKRRTTSVPPPAVARQSSALSSKQVKAQAEGSAQNMTVETETVPSIPQVALATGNKTDGVNGSLKTKPSSETIKPKKDKKKPARKQAAVSSGNASSKADIFEAKIASAVDEANTSDSEETFVYDSNPPEATDRSHRRFHSRTPSATSMASQADRQNLRSIYGVMEGGPAHGHRKSMKFVNTSNGSGVDSLTPGDEDGRSTIRSTNGSGRGTARQHHHIGRWGRNPGNGHPSLFDNESPFPNAARAKMASSRNSSGPPSPRNHSGRGHLHPKRSTYQLSSSYDQDGVNGADDERTPLLESGRSSRRKRGPLSLRQTESQLYTRRASYLNRFAACLVLTMMFLLVITGAIGFMFATSQPMTDIKVVSIKNVVSSEPVLMFDLTVKAHNPNIVVVTIDQANLEIFARSQHGEDDDWWKHVLDPPKAHSQDGIWPNPIDDPNDDDDSVPNFLIGRITEFDSPLTFEGSLFHQGSSASTAELQLANPGNGTTGGVERWNRIFQNEFDLLVKGVVKYSLPLSARVRSATISGRTTVKPNSANDPSLKPNATMVP